MGGGSDLSVSKSPGDSHTQVWEPLVWCQFCEPNATFANKMWVFFFLFFQNYLKNYWKMAPPRAFIGALSVRKIITGYCFLSPGFVGKVRLVILRVSLTNIGNNERKYGILFDYACPLNQKSGKYCIEKIEILGYWYFPMVWRKQLLLGTSLLSAGKANWIQLLARPSIMFYNACHLVSHSLRCFLFKLGSAESENMSSKIKKWLQLITKYLRIWVFETLQSIRLLQQN